MNPIEIEVDDALLDDFERFARLEGRTVNELIQEAMELYLKVEKERLEAGPGIKDQ